MIRLQDIHSLKKVKNIRLVAGRGGLNRFFSNIVVYEYDPNTKRSGTYYQGDFVVTTLIYAKDNPALVVSTLTALMEQGIVGLLIKSVHYPVLPAEVLARADEKNIPIFLFDDTYMEEVIVEVTSLINSARKYYLYENDLDRLYREPLSSAEVLRIAELLIPGKAERYCLWAIRGPETDSGMGLTERLATEIETRFRLAPWSSFLCTTYQGWCILIHAAIPEADPARATDADLNTLLTAADLAADNVTIGRSSISEDRRDFRRVFRECLFAEKYCRVRGLSFAAPSDIGEFYLLFAAQGDPDTARYFAEKARLLLDYDRDNKTSLWETLRVYTLSDFDVARSSTALYQHPNTIRYRISRIREVLGTRSEADFHALAHTLVYLDRIAEE